jgi:hypothetical protein
MGNEGFAIACWSAFMVDDPPFVDLVDADDLTGLAR